MNLCLKKSLVLGMKITTLYSLHQILITLNQEKYNKFSMQLNAKL